MSCDPRKRIWSIPFSVHPPSAEPWIRRALTVSRTASRTCRAIVSLASLIGSQVPVADEQRNRRRRHAHTPRPPSTVATRTITDGSGVVTIHVPSIPVAEYPQRGSSWSLSGPQFVAALSASNFHVPSARGRKTGVWVLMKPSGSPEDGGNLKLVPLLSKNAWEMVRDPPASS